MQNIYIIQKSGIIYTDKSTDLYQTKTLKCMLKTDNV